MGNINLFNFLQIKLASVLFVPSQESKTNKGRRVREKPKTHYTDEKTDMVLPFRHVEKWLSWDNMPKLWPNKLC